MPVRIADFLSPPSGIGLSTQEKKQKQQKKPSKPKKQNKQLQQTNADQQGQQSNVSKAIQRARNLKMQRPDLASQIGEKVSRQKAKKLKDGINLS